MLLRRATLLSQPENEKVYSLGRLAPSPSRMRIFEKKRSVILVAGERDLYFTRGYE